MDSNIIGFAGLAALIITNTFLVGRWVGKINNKMENFDTHCTQVCERTDKRLTIDETWREKHQEHHEELARGQQQ